MSGTADARHKDIIWLKKQEQIVGRRYTNREVASESSANKPNAL